MFSTAYIIYVMFSIAYIMYAMFTIGQKRTAVSTTGKKFISWWKSKISLCKADAASLQPTSCSDFDPRSWKQEECIWNAGFESLGVDTEGSGIRGQHAN